VHRIHARQLDSYAVLLPDPALSTGYGQRADEGHAIGAPNHIRIMYETVLNFLDHHVLGQEWRRAAML
jgi:hypothetical protein